MKKDPSNETLFSLLGNVITVTDINKTLTINNFCHCVTYIYNIYTEPCFKKFVHLLSIMSRINRSISYNTLTKWQTDFYIGSPILKICDNHTPDPFNGANSFQGEIWISVYKIFLQNISMLPKLAVDFLLNLSSWNS